MHSTITMMGIGIIICAILLLISHFKMRALAKNIIQNSTAKAREDYEKLRKYPFDFDGLRKILVENSIDDRIIFKQKKMQDMFSMAIILLCILQFVLLEKNK